MTQATVSRGAFFPRPRLNLSQSGDAQLIFWAANGAISHLGVSGRAKFAPTARRDARRRYGDG